MKTIILGARGMLGRDLARAFSDLTPKLLDKQDLDITDKSSVFSLFKNEKPELVINAAAYTDVDRSETERELAMKVNGIAPGYLAEAAKEIGASFVHYSTDYVFHGDNAEGYKEDDEPGSPINYYGETKLAGEQAIRNAGGKNYIIRTSWLFGLGGKNFVETILGLAGKMSSLRVVDDQHGKPTYTVDLAKRTREIVGGIYEPGIYHVINEPATTWYNFAAEIIEKGHRSDVRVFPVSSDNFPRPAKRPQYSILLNTKLPPMRHWEYALLDYLSSRKF